MMGDDERERPCDEAQKWNAQIELPAEMVQGFRAWWDSEGWWSFRAWHERTSGADSEWETFMRRLCGQPPAQNRLPECCDPIDPKVF